MELDDLLQQLRWMFNLPTLATAEEVLAEVTKASELIKAQTPAAAKAGFHIAEHITALTQQVAADPDPSKFVSVATMKSLQDELAALRKQQTDAEVDGLVVAALSDGRLLPAQEAWARGLGAKDVADLKAYIETAQPITALTSTQTKGKPVIDENGAIQLDENQLAICKQMGIKPEDYKATLAAEAETA